MSKQKPSNDKGGEVKYEEGRVVVKTEIVALLYGVTPRTVRDWNKKKGLPQFKRGWYDLREVIEWKTNDAESLEARKLLAETEYREYKAEREALNLAIQRGELLPREKVAEEWSGRILEIKKSLLVLEKTVANRFTDPDIQIQVGRTIKEEVRRFLVQYARDGKYTPEN